MVWRNQLGLIQRHLCLGPYCDKDKQWGGDWPGIVQNHQSELKLCPMSLRCSSDQQSAYLEDVKFVRNHQARLAGEEHVSWAVSNMETSGSCQGEGQRITSSEGKTCLLDEQNGPCHGPALGQENSKSGKEFTAATLLTVATPQQPTLSMSKFSQSQNKQLQKIILQEISNILSFWGCLQRFAFIVSAKNQHLYLSSVFWPFFYF